MTTLSNKNYFSEISKIDLSNMPASIKEGHEFLKEATENGADWTLYNSDETVKETIDLYFGKLNQILAKKEEPEKPVPTVKAAKPASPKHKVPQKSNSVSVKKEHLPLLTERIPEELKFMRRFANLNGKTKTKEEILRFINSLQRAIVEKRIRKTSSYASAIRFVQGKLIDLYNTMRSKVTIELTPQSLGRLKQSVQSVAVMPDIQYLKKYISLNGKKGIKDKVAKLIKQMDKAHDKGQLHENSSYADAVDKAYKNLLAYAQSKVDKPLMIEEAELNGLNGILNGNTSLSGTDNADTEVKVMNSMDFVKMKFEKLGFTGKWLELIGDPSPGFTAMVFGKPKTGKSYFCVEFAGYLARNHGKVLYVAKEEGFNTTFNAKLEDKNAVHPNLVISETLLSDISPYNFIFLDSVTRLNLEPEDLEHLKKLWPGKSFIYVFQTTKMGNFRGAQSFMHDVDVILHVPEKGKVVQMGRFNQGGEMEIFAQAA